MAIYKPTSLGKVVVTTAGTRKQILTTSTPAQIVQIQQFPGNTGKIYIGGSTLVGSTGVGVYFVLPIPTVNSLSSWLLQWPDSHAMFDLADLYLDAEVNGEGAIVSYVNV